jgi:phosphomannomutase
MDSNESAVLTALKIIKYAQQSGLPLSEMIKPFQKYYYSGETIINSSLNADNIGLILAKLKEKYKDGEISEFDGLTIEYWTSRPAGNRWWFNVRSSNTEPVIRLVVESDSEILLKEKKKEVEEEIKNTETNR